MESWKRVWREFAALLPTRGLEALRVALRGDDPGLIQGATTMPPSLQCVQDWPCEGACPVGYAGWKGGTLRDDTIKDVEEFFGSLCFEVDKRLGEAGAVRYLLNWIDETPREEMRRLLLPEVELTLAEREDLCV